MDKKSFIRLFFIILIITIGSWLLFQRGSLTPENISRSEAVQQALGPGGVRGGTGNVVVDTDDGQMIFGEPVAPAVVDLNTVPSRPAEFDRLKQAYEAGQIDLGINEGPVSEAVYQAMIAESLEQGVDHTVQNYLGTGLDGITAPAALSQGVNFKAIDYTQSQQGVPPDPDIMVGKDHVVVGVNTSFQVFDKQGNSLVGPILYEDFWGSNCGTGSNVVMFDPYSGYDEENGRYVLGITAYDPNVNGGDNGYACIAVSQTDSAAGSYWLYSFDGNPGGGTDYFFDYPHIGIGQDALYLGANMFGTFFVRNHIFAFEKDDMYAGASASYLKYNVGSGNFTIQPAKLKGFQTGGWPTNANEPHYFVDADFGNNRNTLTVWQFSDPWGSPSFSQAGTVTVNSYSLPVNQPQLGGSSIQANDNRLLDVEYWGGKLWTTHTIGCNPGSGTVNCVRWYEIDMSSGSPSLDQQGTFATSGVYNSFPDLGVNACGDMVVGYTKTSSSIYPSVYAAGRQAGDANGTLKDETLLHAGEAPYTAYDSVPRRWGDYTGLALDPDGKTFWYVGEYSREQSTARWSTWVSAMSWPECTIEPTATPTSGPSPTPTNTPEPLSCTTYNSSDTPINLPNGVNSINSTINIGNGVTIADVNIDVDMAHDWVGDLIFTLSKGTTSATIIDRPGVPASTYGCNIDDILATLDDEAVTSVENQCSNSAPAISGTHAPNNPLAVFDGQNSSGNWTLQVADAYPGTDPGTLNSWSIEICGEEASPTATNTPEPPSPTPTNTPVPPTATPTNTPEPQIVQQIALTTGWNMISSYMIADDPSMESLLAGIEDDMFIIKNGDGLIYWPSQGINNLGDWQVQEGYQIYMNNPATLSIEGSQVDPANTPINLPFGWSLVAYLRDQSMSVDQALSSVSTDLFLVKDGAGLVYWPELELDQIGSMNPGEGYQIYMSNSGILTYPGN